ncbi:MAG TPA: TonB-dependent receptor [Allosphingosinicella sp.]|jgi:outer membrane receptor protein involved in Fe transport
MRALHLKALSTVSFAALAAFAAPGVAQAQTDGAATDTACTQQNQDERAACERARQEAQPPVGSSSQPTNVESPAGIQNTGTELPPAQGVSSEEAIIVTGSRIARPNFDTVEPSVVVTSADIETRGFETLGQALNELPAFGIPGSSPVSVQSSFGPGQSFVNFLGLGDQRTLTLVNGNRFVSSNTASLFGPTGSGSQVDLNLIPTALIDRVETIAVGGAPIYGSDAVAGTINIILKRNFSGLQVDAQHGITEYGDVPNYRFRALAGYNFAGGRGNVTVAGEYNNQGGLLFTDRPVLNRGEFYGASRDRNSPFVNQLFQNQRFNILSEFGVPLTSDFFPLDPTRNADLADLREFFGFNPNAASPYDFLTNYLPGPNFSQNDFYCGLYGYCANFSDAQGNALRFDSAGNLVPIEFGTRPSPNELPLQFGSSGGNGLDLNRVTNLLTPLKRYSAVGLANFEVSDHLRLYGEAWYTHSEGRNLADQPAYNSAAFGGGGEPGGNLIIRADNPFLSPQARAIIQAQAPHLAELGGAQGFFFSRANTDISTRQAIGKVDVMRFVGGAEGSFDVGGNQWKWDVTGNYGHSRTHGRNPELLEQNFNNAVDAVRDASGNIVCRPGYTNSPFPSGSATCAPLNLFGTNQASAAALNYITGYSTPESVNTQFVGTASLTGSLFRLPGGKLGFAVGYEHRKETFDFEPGPLLLGGPDTDPTTDSDGDGNKTNDCSSFTRDACITPVKGSFHTNEYFAELRAPIFSPSNAVPFMRTLELQAAFRWVQHSAAGGDPAWTVGGRWAPIKDITFRGNYTHSIRSPAVTEISLPRSPGFFFATDPCDANQLKNGPDPATRKKNCAAAGIPTTFRSRSASATFPGITLGNPDLQNERAKAFSLGVVLAPRFLQGFTLSADYVDVRLNNAISFFGASAVLASCYDSPNFPANQFCSRFTRSTAPGTLNQLNFVQTSFFNADRLQYQGVLSDLDYRVNTPFLGATSKLGFRVSAQYLKKLEQASGAGAPVLLRGDIGYPKISAVGTVTYTNSGLLLQLSANYSGPVRLSINDPINTYPDPTLDSFTTFNAAVAWDVTKAFSFRIAVDNIFSANFPKPGPGAGGAITYFPSILGTDFRVGATLRF